MKKTGRSEAEWSVQEVNEWREAYVACRYVFFSYTHTDEQTDTTYLKPPFPRCFMRASFKVDRPMVWLGQRNIKHILIFSGLSPRPTDGKIASIPIFFFFVDSEWWLNE